MRNRKHHLAKEVFDGNPAVVLVTACTSNRSRWMEHPDLAPIVCEEIGNLHQGPVDVFGYCVMPDHLHLLVATGGTQLSEIVKQLKGRVSRRIRLVDAAVEGWQRGYHDHIVRRNEGLLQTLEYVLMNPVRGGLARNWWEYPYLGTPIFGEAGPRTLVDTKPEDLLWNELLGGAD
ncbi:MAG: hypothetical protein GY906_39585 [bacterium]|nr:hypothetical protein [bacterium]